jgi:3-phenylpropionate/trans-cinnamate dioxygenase ferredoxin reductase subunit
MDEQHIVIVGAGIAANEAAVALRERNSGARVTLIGKEPVPYYRPHLLPDFISGRIEEPALFPHPFERYSELGVHLRLGQAVTDVDFTARSLTLSHKERVRFDGLILAVGSRPRIPEPLQVFEDLMLPLKTLADAREWKRRLREADSVLIVGGDLTSFSFVRALLTMGKRVSFILNEESFWPVPLDGEVRAQVEARLTAKGVEIVECARVRAMARKDARAIEVETDCGLCRADLVGAFFGLVPDVRFLARSGLHIERGVLVDEYLNAGFPGVYAAGDCAQVYHPGLRDYWVSIGFENARRLGRLAALNLLGAGLEADAPGESLFNVEGVRVNTSWWTEF